MAKLSAQRAKQGKPLPVAMRDKPQLREEHADYWQAFLELSGSRTAGFGPEPIQITSVMAWCQLYGVPQERWMSFWRVLRAVDAAYLKATADKEKAASGNTQSSSGRERVRGRRQAGGASQPAGGPVHRGGRPRP